MGFQLKNLFKKNVELKAPLKTSSWRKVAIGTWRSAKDPSVYAEKDFDAHEVLDYIEKLRKKSGKRITITHFVGKAVAETMRRHPSINCILRFGRLYPREHVDIFFQVATDSVGEDLSGVTIREMEKKSVQEIAEEMETKVKKAKAKTDPTFQKTKSLFSFLPGFLSPLFLDLSSFILYTLNLWSPVLGTPRDAFGGCMITNIGSLGLDHAYGPLVPYSKVPILVVIGAVREEPAVFEGKVVPRKKLPFTVTFDHRLIDGVHGAQMAQTMVDIFKDPEKELPK